MEVWEKTAVVLVNKPKARNKMDLMISKFRGNLQIPRQDGKSLVMCWLYLFSVFRSGIQVHNIPEQRRWIADRLRLSYYRLAGLNGAKLRCCR